MSDINWTNGDSLDDIFGGPTVPVAPRTAPTDAAMTRIRETVPEFTETCPKCRGTGRFGRFGQCYGCKGKGSKSFRTSPETRAQAKAYRDAQPARNEEAFKAQYANEHAWIVRSAPTFGFAASMLNAVRQFGGLTTGQMLAVQKCMQPRERPAQPAAPSIMLPNIVSTFAAAKLAKPSLVFGDITLRRAYAGGVNAGGVDVRYKGEYLTTIKADGMIKRPVSEEFLAMLVKIDADPSAAARDYGIKTGICCCCNATLTNPESIKLGIGPICRGKWGF